MLVATKGELFTHRPGLPGPLSFIFEIYIQNYNKKGKGRGKKKGKQQYLIKRRRANHNFASRRVTSRT